jgi:hypothetical protein
MVHFEVSMIRDGRLTLTAVFYRTTAGREPCRDWLRGLTDDDRRAVGYDLKTARVRLASLQEERSR